MSNTAASIEPVGYVMAPEDVPPPAPRPRTRTRKGDTGADADAEVHALSQCLRLLSDLDEHAQARVLRYLTQRFVPMAVAVASVSSLDSVERY